MVRVYNLSNSAPGGQSGSDGDCSRFELILYGFNVLNDSNIEALQGHLTGNVNVASVNEKDIIFVEVIDKLNSIKLLFFVHVKILP
jgi:hypothetical protein